MWAESCPYKSMQANISSIYDIRPFKQNLAVKEVIKRYVSSNVRMTAQISLYQQDSF